MPRWRLIAKALGLPIEEPMETYHTSDHLFADLHIPRGVSGTLPRSQRTLAGLDAEEIEDLGETGRHDRDRGRARTRGRRGGRDGGRGSRLHTSNRRGNSAATSKNAWNSRN